MTRPIVHRIHTRDGWEWTEVPPRRALSRICAALACVCLGAGLTVVVMLSIRRPLMARFILLTQYDEGETVAVSVNHIQSVRLSFNSKITWIQLIGEGDDVGVTESFDDVMRLIEEAADHA